MQTEDTNTISDAFLQFKVESFQIFD